MSYLDFHSEADQTYRWIGCAYMLNGLDLIRKMVFLAQEILR